MFVGLLSPSQELPLTNTKLVTTKTTPYFGAISTTFNNSNDLSCEKKLFQKKNTLLRLFGFQFHHWFCLLTGGFENATGPLDCQLRRDLG
jgi:hypothetical protein